MLKKCFFLLLLSFLSLQNLAQENDWQLSENLLIGSSDTRFTMAYPTGWQTGSERGNTVISELEQDQAIAFGEAFAVEGYLIRFQRFSVRGLRQMGINRQEDSLETAIQKLGEAQGYAAEREISETSLLTWPALRLRSVDSLGNHFISIIAYYEFDFIRLTLAAPSAESLDAFLPTWETMLDSIQMQKGQAYLGDYALNFECAGEGNPTVILEMGWNVQGYEYMRPILDGVSEFTRICIMDRHDELGMGAVEDYVADLHQVLQVIEAEPPYIMAGHSYGGFTLRVFADEYPDEVVGIVLIDSSHPEQSERLDAAWGAVHPDLVAPYDPEWARAEARVRETGSLGDMPLIVLTAEHFTIDSGEAYAEDHEIYLRPLWVNELQVELVALSTRGRQIIVEGTTHVSLVSHPATVDAIREVVELVRAENPS